MSELIKQVRVALIGCGAVSRNYYAPALSKLAADNLVTVDLLHDPVAHQIMQLKEIFPNAKEMSNFAELDNVELAIVASPVAYHASQTIDALANGCSVLCEKPMATNLADCQAMIAAAEHGNILAVGHFRRFVPALRAIKEILDTGVLGKVKSFKLAEGGPFQWPAASSSFFKREQAGGGVFLDLGVHVMDLMLWWFGQPSRVRYADDAMGGVEANCRLVVEFASGMSGTVILSRDWWLSNRYRIDCTKGSLSWKVFETKSLEVQVVDNDQSVVDEANKILQRHSCNLGQTTQDNPLDCFFDQLKSVVNAVRVGDSRVPGIVSGEEAAKSLALIEQCYANRELISMPWLTEHELQTAKQMQENMLRSER